MLSKSLGSPMKRNLLGFVMRYGTNKEKNTKLGEGLRRLAYERRRFVKSKKTSKTAVVLIAGVPGTSSYHLVPKHLRATWPRPEQSHLLPEACSPNGIDNRQKCQRRTKRPPPEPSDILKRCYALYDDKRRYYMKGCLNWTAWIIHFCPKFHKWSIRF